MGTSKGYGGPPTGLVPSWVDEPTPGVPPVPPLTVSPLGGAPKPTLPVQPAPGPSKPLPQPDLPSAGSLSIARNNFTRFARNGSPRSLGRALSSYVRAGTGGAGRAARRMGASRATGARLLGIIQDVQRLGAPSALLKLNLPGLAGQPASDVFLKLLEFVCPPGGAIDEAIARQAMLESIGDLAEAGVGDFDTMTSDQLQEFFLDFIARSIEGRVMADLGAHSVTIPDDVAVVENAQQQLHDFVTGCIHGELSQKLSDMVPLKDSDLGRAIDQIYEAAFALVAAAGEAAK